MNTRNSMLLNHHKGCAVALILIVMLVLIPAILFYREYRQTALNRGLIEATKSLDVQAVSKLLASGADPNTRDTPETHASFLEMLLSMFRKHNIDTSPPALWVALNQLQAGNYLPHATTPVVVALINAGADVNARDEHGESPLSQIMFIGYSNDSAQMLESLLSAGARIDEFESGGFTALMTAVFSTETDYERILLAHGANPNLANMDGATPLLLACGAENAQGVRMLLDKGADPNPKPTKLGTPLSYARDAGSTEIIKLLVAHGAKR